MGLFESIYPRQKLDRYFTPEWVTSTLLPHLGHGKLLIWEPCCGNGKITRVLQSAGHTVISSDIEPLDEHLIPGGAIKADFLTWKPENLSDVDAIVTNCPFGRAGPLFVRRALNLMCENRGMVNMLLPMNWDTASTRRDLFSEQPAFMKKIVLTRRIVWFERGGDEDPKQNHAWFCWDFTYRGAPTISYAP